jgi:DNA-binding CsgD family transcriptional regulator
VWRALLGLPFASMTRNGVEFHAVARQAIAGALEIRDPVRVRRLRSRAAVAALRGAAGGRSWAATADLLYLVQNPVIRDSYLPPEDLQHPVEAARAADLPAILEITERHDGPAAAPVMQAWWRTHPEAFSVARGADGAVTAFSTVLRRSALDRALVPVDPAVAAILDVVDRHPLPPGAEALINRRMLSLRRGEAPAPEVGALVVDLKRLYLELRPGLRKVFSVHADWARVAPVLRVLGFDDVGAAASIGGRSYQVCVLDFGPDGVDGWLLRHVLVESGQPAAAEVASSPAVHPADRPPVLRLSAREREVLAVLAEGATNTELAQRLFISERTVNRHLSNIFTKLGVRNRTAAARVAIESGLVV